LTLAMEVQHSIEAAIGQNIRVENRELLLACDKSTVDMQSAGTPQQFGLVRHRNLYWAPIRCQKLLNAFAMCVGIDEHAINTIKRAPLQPDAKQGRALDRHQALGNAAC
jgi:hypothetical protein